jgi:hypothetical protein
VNIRIYDRNQAAVPHIVCQNGARISCRNRMGKHNHAPSRETNG